MTTAAASPTHGKDRYVVITLRDSLGVLLLVLLLPLWMAVGLGFVALVVARHLYWWARGNTTAVSRGAAGSTRSRPPGGSRPTSYERPTAAGAAPAALAAAGDVAGRAAL